jgi:hypothetical protein
MTEATKQLPPPESQKQRWIKYGANVILASVVVIALAVVVTYLAQRAKVRLDTTQAGLYSLKPQTVNIIKDNKQKIRLVSLYAPIQGARNDAERRAAEEHANRMGVVADLLREYEYKGKNISVEIIDPIASPTKVDDLIKDVTNKYGGEVAKYKEVVDAQPATYTKLNGLVAEQLKKVNALPLEQLIGNEALQGVGLAIFTVQEFPEVIKSSEATIKRRLADKPPDYKGVTSSVERAMDYFSARSATIIDNFTKSKDDAKLPEPVRKYMTDSLPTFTEVKKIADEFSAKIKGLGELKLDELRTKLKEENAILVLGEKDMRSLSFNQVWQRDDEAMRRMRPGEEVRVQAKFSGEQQISSAILGLSTDKKPKVAFVRSGGPPVTGGGFFQQGEISFSRFADRLRTYNFEVLEKDLSGQWAMMAQMQQMPTEPEPSDEDIKDAVWVVVPTPSRPNRMGQQPPPIAPKIAAHLKNGGSALVLLYPQGDNLAEALGEWGIDVETNVFAAHEASPAAAASAGDVVEDAQRYPFIFVTNTYGDHFLTKPLQSLDMFLPQMMPVKIRQVAGYKTTPLVTLPQGAWGERNAEAMLRGEAVKYEPAKDGAATGDIPGPISVAVASEKENGGGRVVAIGGMQVAIDGIVSMEDPNLARRDIRVLRFPGNGELVTNSVFWLAKQDPLIAISPAAMEVSRIAPMSTGTLQAWRIGALLIGLPGLVIAAGAYVWFARRD